MKALISHKSATSGPMDRIIVDCKIDTIESRRSLIETAVNYVGYKGIFVIEIFADDKFYAEPVKVINCNPAHWDEVVEVHRWICGDS